jgi:type IV pilus assembly protein PilB
MQMHRQIGLTFASARCAATSAWIPTSSSSAKSATRRPPTSPVEAALTGHLLDLHAPHQRRPGTVARLTEMGVEPFMISSSLVCVCAQRLMRRVCKNCKVAYEPEGREKEII